MCRPCISSDTYFCKHCKSPALSLLAVGTIGQKPVVKLLPKILAVAHSVAQNVAKAAQNTPFRCGTVCRKLLICIRWEYSLAIFKTAAFSQLGHSSVRNSNVFFELARSVRLVALDDEDGFIINAVLLAPLAQLVVPL